MTHQKQGIDTTSDHFQLLLRYITYEQVSALKRTIEVLNELCVTQLTPEVLSESNDSQTDVQVSTSTKEDF